MQQLDASAEPPIDPRLQDFVFQGFSNTVDTRSYSTLDDLDGSTLISDGQPSRSNGTAALEDLSVDSIDETSTLDYTFDYYPPIPNEDTSVINKEFSASEKADSTSESEAALFDQQGSLLQFVMDVPENDKETSSEHLDALGDAAVGLALTELEASYGKEDSTTVEDVITSEPQKWFELLSTYNCYFPSESKQREMEKKIPAGNSRDPPTPFLIRCAEHPQFTFKTWRAYQEHMELDASKAAKAAELEALGQAKSTKPGAKQVKKKEHVCPYAGEGEGDRKAGPWSCKNHLAQHMQTHQFQKDKPCAFSEKCGSEEIFTVLAKWRFHLRDAHEPPQMEKKACPLKEERNCDFETVSIANWNLHLGYHHMSREWLEKWKIDIRAYKKAKKQGAKDSAAGEESESEEE